MVMSNKLLYWGRQLAQIQQYERRIEKRNIKTTLLVTLSKVRKVKGKFRIESNIKIVVICENN